jgi:nucleoside 2-deoxyribosyltransferase
MVKNINTALELISVTDQQLDVIAKEEYNILKNKLCSVLAALKDSRYINEKYLYPPQVTTVSTGTVYISAPMSTLDEDSYKEQRKLLEKVRDSLLSDAGFSKVICPAIDIKDTDSFDGTTKAIIENFENLKQSDKVLIIYPNSLPTSTLVEAGYVIGMSKKTLIFYKDRLPYMLKESGTTIPHVRTVTYTKNNDIVEYLQRNGEASFGINYDE